MGTFFTVLLVIIAIIALFGLIFWPILLWMGFLNATEEWSIKTKVLHTVGSIVVFAAIISFGINSGFFESNNSSHCGPGTDYSESSHYNPATKTVQTDWVCEAR